FGRSVVPGWRAADARGPDARATTLLSGRNPRGRQHPQGHTAAGVARADECAAKHEGDIAADALAASRVKQASENLSPCFVRGRQVRIFGLSRLIGRGGSRLSKLVQSSWVRPPPMRAGACPPKPTAGLRASPFKSPSGGQKQATIPKLFENGFQQ